MKDSIRRKKKAMADKNDRENDPRKGQRVQNAGGIASILSDILPLWQSLRVAAFLTLVVVIMLPGPALAQGEGAHNYFPAPTGTNVFSATFMDLKSNFNLRQTVQIKDADLQAYIGALTYKHFFPLSGRLTEFTFTAVMGNITGTLIVDPRATGVNRTINATSGNGFSDAYIGIRVGLIGAPALKLPEFMKHKQGFQLYALAGAYMPIGKYSSSKPLNLGANQWAIRFGAPMVMPFGNPAHPVSLEVVPVIVFYTANNEPFGKARRIEQDPVFQVENHLSYNLTKKLWGSLDLRFQYGGETKTDGVPDDNHLEQLGGGATLGYAVTPKFGVQVTYGNLIYKNDNSNARMWRLRAVYVF